MIHAHSSLPRIALGACLIWPGTLAAQDTQALIENALSAAPPMVAENATVMNMKGEVLREGVGNGVGRTFVGSAGEDTGEVGAVERSDEARHGRHPLPTGAISLSSGVCVSKPHCFCMK